MRIGEIVEFEKIHSGGLWKEKEKEFRVMIRFMAWAVDRMNEFTEIGSTRED